MVVKKVIRAQGRMRSLGVESQQEGRESPSARIKDQ